MRTTIHHDSANSRFHLEEIAAKTPPESDSIGPLAELNYRRKEKELWIMHCGTQTEARGRGLAGLLMAAAVEFAREEGLSVVPVCSYALHAFNKQSPEWDDVLQK